MEKSSEEKIFTVKITGQSMQPTLRDGSTVIARQTDKVNKTDIAVMESNGIVTVHRIIDEIKIGKETWYVHKGDNSSIFGLAKEEEIDGIVELRCAHKRHGGFTSLLMTLIKLGAFLTYIGIYPFRKDNKTLTTNIFPLLKRINNLTSYAYQKK
jgi:hypothetical protein